jgi:hypothetical protein
MVVHIGLKFNENEKAFKWISGDEVTYTNWGVGQPGDF